MAVFLDSIKNYIGFTDADTNTLRELLPVAEPHLQRFVDRFYDQIAADPDAHQVLAGPEQVARLKQTLIEWFHSGLSGPHDERYYQRRARIGRVHVNIGLPQRFMFTAMNLIRTDLHHLVVAELARLGPDRMRFQDAIDRLCDMELAIMLETFQEDSDARLRRHERLATIGQIAASIGHDLRNPLGVMQSSLYLLRKRAGPDPRVHRHVDKIDNQIRLCDDIINNLLELARSSPPRREPIDFARLFQEAIEAADVPAGIEVHTHIAHDLACRADPFLLRQALVNLISNACQAYQKPQGRIYLSAMNSTEGAIIEVADDGPGFDDDTLTSVFEPLVTTRVNGIGLGLALVKGVTERHRGSVEAMNRPDGGALVRIRIPNGEDEVFSGHGA